MNRPLISLSVPVYGTESSLPALLDSILAQNLLLKTAVQKSGFFSNNKDTLPIEILIVNDGSPGGSSLPKILKLYKKKFKNLGIPLTLLEHSKNLGLVEARRTLVNAACGDYVFYRSR